MHITILYDTDEERKLAQELQLALWYGHDFGSALIDTLQNDVDITVLEND